MRAASGLGLSLAARSGSPSSAGRGGPVTAESLRAELREQERTDQEPVAEYCGGPNLLAASPCFVGSLYYGGRQNHMPHTTTGWTVAFPIIETQKAQQQALNPGCTPPNSASLLARNLGLGYDRAASQYFQVYGLLP